MVSLVSTRESASGWGAAREAGASRRSRWREAMVGLVVVVVVGVVVVGVNWRLRVS